MTIGGLSDYFCHIPPQKIAHHVVSASNDVSVYLSDPLQVSLCHNCEKILGCSIKSIDVLPEFFTGVLRRFDTYISAVNLRVP